MRLIVPNSDSDSAGTPSSTRSFELDVAPHHALTLHSPSTVSAHTPSSHVTAEPSGFISPAATFTQASRARRVGHVDPLLRGLDLAAVVGTRTRTRTHSHRRRHGNWKELDSSEEREEEARPGRRMRTRMSTRARHLRVGEVADDEDSEWEADWVSDAELETYLHGGGDEEDEYDQEDDEDEYQDDEG